MSRELVEEIMQLEAGAEQDLEHARKEAERIIRKAHEDALRITQDAEHTLEQGRQERINAHDLSLHQEKATALGLAKQEASNLAKQVQPRIAKAASLLKTRFLERLDDTS